MRPVPVVFLLMAFSDQLSILRYGQVYWDEGGGHRVGDVHFLVFAAGYPQLEQVCFWTWKERRPQRRHMVCDLFCYSLWSTSPAHAVNMSLLSAIPEMGLLLLLLREREEGGGGWTNVTLSERAVFPHRQQLILQHFTLEQESGETHEVPFVIAGYFTGVGF